MCLAPHFFTSPFPRRIKKGKRNAQARLITLSQNGYGAHKGHYFGMFSNSGPPKFFVTSTSGRKNAFLTHFLRPELLLTRPPANGPPHFDPDTEGEIGKPGTSHFFNTKNPEVVSKMHLQFWPKHEENWHPI